MGTDDALDYLKAIELSDEELKTTLALVDRLYAAYTGFVGEMHDWVTSHTIEALRGPDFFHERVTGEPSRPLSAQELRDHRTPVRIDAPGAARGPAPEV